MSTYTLDFSLTTEEQRCAAITSICSQASYTQKQYTQMADYILLANPEKIYPEEFHSPYIIHDEQSLDELMDNPVTADVIDSTCIPLYQAKHAPRKRKLNRNDSTHSSIPGMQNLWIYIDDLKLKLKDEPNNYKLKRTLIDLYKQQYSLLEAYYPNWTSYTTITKYSPTPKNIIPEEYREKLCTPTYMARFLIQLPVLLELSQNNDELTDLLSLIQKALSLVPLTPLQQDVLNLYQKQIPCATALSYIKEKYNRCLTQSYFSIILYKQIAPKVVDEYSELYYAEKYRNDPSKWRTCLCCKQSKLLTKHNWYHFSNKPQGFALICKECTNIKKKNRKEKIQNG